MDKKILNRLYVVSGALFVFSIAIIVQLFNVQFVDGEKYRDLATHPEVDGIQGQ